MRLFIQLQELNAALSVVTKAMSAKTPMPVLEGIHLEATREGLCLTCTDLALQIETKIPAAVEREGSVVVPGRLFSDMMRRMPEESVLLSCESNTVNIACGKLKTTIQGIDAKEFPEMPQVKDGMAVELTQRSVRDIVRQTIFATAQDETKPILTGVLMEFEAEALIAVALDGYRLALRREPCNTAGENEPVIIPARSMLEISRILQDADDTIAITFAKTHVLFDMDHTRIVTRLIEGEFTRYRQILPTEHKSRVRINRQQLLDSIERASLVAREDKSNLVKMHFKADGLHISANSEAGMLDEEVNIDLLGEEIKIAFNARYFTDVLKALDDEEIYLDMNNNINPCVVKPIQGDRFYYLILPMRLFNH